MTGMAGLTVQAATRLQALMLRAKAVSVAGAATEPEEGTCTDFPVKKPHLDIVTTGVTGIRRQPTLGCRQKTHATQAENIHTHTVTHTHTRDMLGGSQSELSSASNCHPRDIMHRWRPRILWCSSSYAG